MATMRIHTPLSVVTAFLIAVPSASALMLTRPILLPVSSSSSSSSSTESSASSSTTSSSSESSVSSSSGISSSRPMLQLLKPKSSSSASSTSSSTSAFKLKQLKKQKKDVDDYCKAINTTLAKGSAITTSETNATYFNMTIDLLTKASALCGAMQATTQDAASSSSSSSSSGYYDPLKKMNECSKVGEEINPLTKVKYCKYLCPSDLLHPKLEVCPKE